MSLKFDDVAFDLEPDTVSEPFSIDGGYYIIKVLEKGDRALDEATREQLEANAFGYWLEEQREKKVERKVDEEGLEKIYEWAAGQIGG
jgi:parvulin-like peptidyl-prolyl isomerase